MNFVYLVECYLNVFTFHVREGEASNVQRHMVHCVIGQTMPVGAPLRASRELLYP